MDYPKLQTLQLERKGPVGWLINNRPEQLNAMNALMRDEFELAWRALDADPEVRVIVHTGAGRAFQTGVDVTEIATDGEGMQRYRESVENFSFTFTATFRFSDFACGLRTRSSRFRRRSTVPCATSVVWSVSRIRSGCMIPLATGAFSAAQRMGVVGPVA